MRTIFISLIILCNVILAQDSLKLNQIELTWSPTLGAQNLFRGFFLFSLNNEIEYHVEDDFSSGMFTLAYNRFITDDIAIGFLFSHAEAHRYTYEENLKLKTYKKDEKETLQSDGIAFQIKAYYWHYKMLKFYASGAVGYSYQNETTTYYNLENCPYRINRDSEDDTYIYRYLYLQLSPLCFEFGSKINITLETGMGYKFLFLGFGLTYCY